MTIGKFDSNSQFLAPSIGTNPADLQMLSTIAGTAAVGHCASGSSASASSSAAALSSLPFVHPSASSLGQMVAANPYACWSATGIGTAATEWELAAMALGRSATADVQQLAQLGAASSAQHPYGQMGAAAAMSAASFAAVPTNSSMWYPQGNNGCWPMATAAAATYGQQHYGLPAQRATTTTNGGGTAAAAMTAQSMTAAAALNGYLGANGHYAAGAYASLMSDYYTNAAAASAFPYYPVSGTAALDPTKMAFAATMQYGQQQQQQPYANLVLPPAQRDQQCQQQSMNNSSNDHQSGGQLPTISGKAATAQDNLQPIVATVAASELDDDNGLSPPRALCPQTQQHNNNATVLATSTSPLSCKNVPTAATTKKVKKEKDSSKPAMHSGNTTTAAKRSKKKKGSQAVRATPTEPNQTRVFVWELEDICALLPADHQYRPALDQMLSETLAKLLQIGFQLEHLEEFDQANVEDAQMDEALQNAAVSGAAAAAAVFGADDVKSTTTTIAAALTQQQQQTVENCHQFMPITATVTNSSPNGFQQQQQQIPGTQNNTGTAGGANEGLRRLAAKYRHIRNIYDQHRGGTHQLAALLEHCGLCPVKLLANLDSIEAMSCANAELFRDCLRLIAERSCPFNNTNSASSSECCANVVLSSTPIEAGVAGALARLMLCRMGEHVQAENVFCTVRTGKEATLERLANQFQKKFIVLITANEESRQLAQKEGIPCWFLYNNTDLMKFRCALNILIGDIPSSSSATTTLLMAEQQHQQQLAMLHTNVVGHTMFDGWRTTNHQHQQQNGATITAQTAQIGC